MDEHVLKRDGARDVRFVGELLARESSESHDDTRWTELELYKTDGGQYVLYTVGRTRWQGEFDRYTVDICETAENVLSHLWAEGCHLSWLAKDLLNAAGDEFAELLIEDVD